MCSSSFKLSRRNKMNTEGIPTKAFKKKKTRRLKKRKHFDGEKFGVVPVPVKKAKARTAAPENTTQFLMEDREQVEPVYSSPSGSSGCSCSSCSVRGSPLSDNDNQSPSELNEAFSEFNFFEKDYNELYENLHAETLHSMTKQQLIDRYLDLEKKEEDLERRIRDMEGSSPVNPLVSILRNRRAKQQQNKMDEITPPRGENSANATDLIAQLEDLQRINRQLLGENERLRGSPVEG